MVKFRTIRVDPKVSAAATWPTPDDQRRTLVSKFLRRMNLDELPQLWSVARGEISPGAPRNEHIASIPSTISWRLQTPNAPDEVTPP